MPNKHKTFKTFAMIVPFVLAFSAATSSAQDRDYDHEARLAELGITLRKASSPVANYVNAVRAYSSTVMDWGGRGPFPVIAWISVVVVVTVLPP